MEMSGRFQVLAPLPPGKETWYPSEKKFPPVWNRSPVVHLVSIFFFHSFTFTNF